MFLLPKDLFFSLKNKHPDISEQEMNNIVDDIFEGILDKAIDNGSCTIRKFGTFISYITFSKRKGKNVVRFKFSISKILNSRLAEDPLIQKRVGKFITHAINANKLNSDKAIQERRATSFEKHMLTYSNRNVTRKLTKSNELRDRIRSLLNGNGKPESSD